MSDWWTEDRRGNLLGFGLRRGRKLTHLTKIIDSGPGANKVLILCGGMMGLVRVDSGLDLTNQDQCEAWKGLEIVLQPVGEIEPGWVESVKNLCPRCQEGHGKHLASLPVAHSGTASRATL